MESNALVASAIATLIAVAWKVAGALVLWVAGRLLIGFALRMLSRALTGQRLDETLALYLRRGLSVILNVVLLVAILGFFGVETTTFAALVAAGGVAIGVAWGGCSPTSRPARSWSSCGRSRSAISSPPAASPARSTRSGCLARPSTRPTTW